MKDWVESARSALKGTLTPPVTEHNEIDWKHDLSPNKTRLVEHLSAMANYPGGGCLVFGVTPVGLPTTLDDTAVSRIVSQLANLGRAAVEPELQIDHACEEYESARLLFVQIPEAASKPVHIRGKGVEESYVRTGGTTRRASRQEVAAMMMTTKVPTWEELNASPIFDDATILSALDLDPIFRMLNRPKFDTRESLIDWMKTEKFIQKVPAGGSYITNLGAISSAASLSSFDSLSRKAVRVIRYKGVDKTSAIKETIGNRGYAIGFQGLLSYILGLVGKSEVIEAALRTSHPMYPEIALREIIANALIHQDFSISGTGPTIEIFDDRIEVTNPGTLLPSRRTDRLIGEPGVSRNEKLGRAFTNYRICEERGSGLLKAAQACEIFGLPPIEFINGSNYFKVTLCTPRTFAQMGEKERLSACYQHATLKYFSSGAMTNKSLRERLKMPEKQRSMVSGLIQKAVERGLVKPADPDNKSMKFMEYLPYWV